MTQRMGRKGWVVTNGQSEPLKSECDKNREVKNNDHDRHRTLDLRGNSRRTRNLSKGIELVAKAAIYLRQRLRQICLWLSSRPLSDVVFSEANQTSVPEAGALKKGSAQIPTEPLQGAD